MEIKYEIEKTNVYHLLTICPHGMCETIGFTAIFYVGDWWCCHYCDHFISIDKEKQIVNCNKENHGN